MRSWLTTILDEAWSLFIDDIGLAIGATATVILTGAAVVIGEPGVITAPLLFLGLASSLLISVWRKARRRD